MNIYFRNFRTFSSAMSFQPMESLLIHFIKIFESQNKHLNTTDAAAWPCRFRQSSFSLSSSSSNTAQRPVHLQILKMYIQKTKNWKNRTWRRRGNARSIKQIKICCASKSSQRCSNKREEAGISRL